MRWTGSEQHKRQWAAVCFWRDIWILKTVIIFFPPPPDWMRRRCLPELFMYFFRPLVWVENQVSCHRWCFSHFIYCGTHIFHCFSTLLKHWRWHESVFCVVWWDIFIWSDWDNRSEVIPICGRSIRTNYRWSHYILALSYCMLCIEVFQQVAPFTFLFSYMEERCRNVKSRWGWLHTVFRFAFISCFSVFLIQFLLSTQELHR